MPSHLLLTQVIWDPLVQQSYDPDTIWLFDPSVEETIPCTDGGLIDYTGAFTSLAACDPWRVGSPFTVEAGKFLQGIRGASTAAWLWMPGEHAPPGSFTVEMWVKADSDWATSAGGAVVSLLAFGAKRSDQEGAALTIQVTAAGRLQAAYRHRSSGTSQVSANINDTVAPSGGAFVGVFLTYVGSTLTLYKAVGGVLSTVGSASVAPAYSWGGNDRGEGVCVLAGKQFTGGGNCNQWVVSDIRVSRVGRVPNVPVDVEAESSIAIGSGSASPVRERMRGFNHYFALGAGPNTSDPSQIGNPVIEATAGTAMVLARTDKFMSATPIKAGGTDATHPTLGNSGLFSYDWRPVDNTLDYYARLGIQPKITIDSTPFLLGGQTAPYNSSQCADTQMLVGFSAFNRQVPSSNTDYATIAADLYHYVTVVRGDDVFGWGFWNEPSLSLFWAGTEAQWLALYAATQSALRALDPDAYLGAPDHTSGSGWSYTWIQNLIQYCALNDIQLDFINHHLYTGAFGDPLAVRQLVRGWCDQYGLGYYPDMMCGEWSMNNGMLFGGSFHPFADVNHWLDAFNASHNAAMLVALQDADHVAAMRYYSGVTGATDNAGEACMGMLSTTGAWAAFNLFRMWEMLGTGDVLDTTSSDLENGVFVQASKSGATTSVLVCNHKWRLDRETPIRVELPDTSLAATAHYVIDANHSNPFEQGSGTGTLEQMALPTVSGGVMEFEMLPRSVHLVTLATPAPPTPRSSPGGSMLPQGGTVYSPHKRASKTGFKTARKTGFKRRRI